MPTHLDGKEIIMAVTRPLPSATTEDPIAAAFEALNSGNDVMDTVYGANRSAPITTPSLNQNMGDDIVEDDSGEEASTVSMTDLAPTAESSFSDNIQEGDATQALPMFEEVWVKGADGKKTKMRVDYNDREAIKKAHLLASGMKLFQAQRDQANKKATEVEAKAKKLEEDFSKLDDILSNQGAPALIDRLLGQGSFDKLIDERIKHTEYLASLSPQEKQALSIQQERDSMRAELEAEKKLNETHRTEITARENESSKRALMSKLQPSFDRYRMAGKLGDPIAEEYYDDAIWTKARARLKQYPAEVELTQAIVDKEFREVSSTFAKMMKGQADKVVKATVDKKKTEAAKQAQVIAARGMQTPGEKAKFIEAIQRGDTKSAFRAFLDGKVKL